MFTIAMSTYSEPDGACGAALEWGILQRSADRTYGDIIRHWPPSASRRPAWPLETACHFVNRAGSAEDCVSQGVEGVSESMNLRN